MNVTIHQWGGVVVDVYQLAKGEKLPRHKHSWSHTTGVGRGRSLITIWYFDIGWIDEREMNPGDSDYVFEANIEHEIEALEDDTIIVNMRTAGPPGQAGADGGITFEEIGTLATIGRCFGC